MISGKCSLIEGNARILEAPDTECPHLGESWRGNMTNISSNPVETENGGGGVGGGMDYGTLLHNSISKVGQCLKNVFTCKHVSGGGRK